MQDLDIKFNDAGELVITKDKGDKMILSQDILEAIWEETEYRKTMEYLADCEEIKQDKTLLKDIERITGYYIAEKDALVENNREILIRLSITDVDMEEEENYEEDEEEFEVIL